MTRLVLWDIDRTLLYVGDVDREIYRDVFIEIVAREPERFPFKGSGRSLPIALRDYFRGNGVPYGDIEPAVQRAIDAIPRRLEAVEGRLPVDGWECDGATAALEAVWGMRDSVATVVTGNLRDCAMVKLRAFNMLRFVDPGVGAYSSDNEHRPALVRIAQDRAGQKYRRAFNRENTVIVGDSIEDVVTAREGGASVICVASDRRDREHLLMSGADRVLSSLSNVSALVEAIHFLTPE